MSDLTRLRNPLKSIKLSVVLFSVSNYTEEIQLI